jgi:hypothetical protein
MRWCLIKRNFASDPSSLGVYIPCLCVLLCLQLLFAADVETPEPQCQLWRTIGPMAPQIPRTLTPACANLHVSLATARQHVPLTGRWADMPAHIWSMISWHCYAGTRGNIRMCSGRRHQSALEGPDRADPQLQIDANTAHLGSSELWCWLWISSCFGRVFKYAAKP